MEMARVHDDSVSATIRYYGARLGVRGEVLKDKIGDELARRIGSGLTRHRRQHTIVEAATVIITGSGELRGPNKVKKIFHVAAQHGEPTKGYVTVRGYEDCVKRVLEEADNFNRRNGWRTLFLRKYPLRSVIFPLFGTRGHGRDGKDVATKLVQAAKTYLETWPHSTIQKVYFLAYTDADLDLCETAFQRLNLKVTEQKAA
jgi:O-acetyl-ADP-ribose deacetylase (regulator of RNase III)